MIFCAALFMVYGLNLIFFIYFSIRGKLSPILSKLPYFLECHCRTDVQLGMARTVYCSSLDTWHKRMLKIYIDMYIIRYEGDIVLFNTHVSKVGSETLDTSIKF